MEVRKIVTGHDDGGRSVFVRDETVDAVGIPGMVEFLQVWGSDGPATYPDGGEEPETKTLFPAVGGVRFMLTTLHPGFDPGMLSGQLADAASVLEEGTDGLHRTGTTDFEIVLSGKLVLELDDGDSRVLTAGDVVVQNGTRHRWRCAGDEPATMLAFMIGAHAR